MTRDWRDRPSAIMIGAALTASIVFAGAIVPTLIADWRLISSSVILPAPQLWYYRKEFSGLGPQSAADAIGRVGHGACANATIGRIRQDWDPQADADVTIGGRRFRFLFERDVTRLWVWTGAFEDGGDRLTPDDVVLNACAGADPEAFAGR